MSKFEKYEQNHPDMLKNPKIAESLRKAKKRRYRRKMELEQLTLLIVGLMLLLACLLLPLLSPYHESIPYFIITFGLMAHGLYFILLKQASECLQDTEKLFYRRKDDSSRLITGVLLNSSHQNISFAYLVFSWLGFIFYMVKFDGADEPMTLPQAIFALILLGSHLFISIMNIHSAKKVDEDYHEYFKKFLKKK